jgi:hypothetical protein
LKDDEALAPSESLNEGTGGGVFKLPLKNGFVLERVGANGFELDAAKNGFFSPLDGEVDAVGINSLEGERRGEGGRAGTGKFGGREGYGFRQVACRLMSSWYKQTLGVRPLNLL